jgi:hypothetical protein
LGTVAPPEVLGAVLEPLIGGQVCGEQINVPFGPSDRLEYLVVVDSADLSPGCGTPGAIVEFRLVGQAADGSEFMQPLAETEIWQPDMHAAGSDR